MTVQAFHSSRKPFYIDENTLLVKFPTASHMNTSHAEWFNKDGIPFIHTVRGYYKEDYIMLYTNDFDIPNVSVQLLVYLFEYFPKINWIGLGCHKSTPGEIWKPKLAVYRQTITDDSTK